MLYLTVKDEISGSGVPESLLEPNTTNSTPIINTIFIPARTFENVTEDEAGVLFSLYNDNALFPIRINQTESENTTFKAIGSSVLSATVANQTITDLIEQINITMSITSLDPTVAQVSWRCCINACITWVVTYITTCTLHKTSMTIHHCMLLDFMQT